MTKKQVREPKRVWALRNKEGKFFSFDGAPSPAYTEYVDRKAYDQLRKELDALNDQRELAEQYIDEQSLWDEFCRYRESIQSKGEKE